jgi:hypothetical protein
VQHGRAAVRGEDLARPVIEVLRAHGQGDVGAARHAEPREVHIEVVDDVAGERVAEDRVRGAAVERLAVERDQQRLLVAREVHVLARHEVRLPREAPRGL